MADKKTSEETAIALVDITSTMLTRIADPDNSTNKKISVVDANGFIVKDWVDMLYYLTNTSEIMLDKTYKINPGINYDVMTIDYILMKGDGITSTTHYPCDVVFTNGFKCSGKYNLTENNLQLNYIPLTLTEAHDLQNTGSDNIVKGQQYAVYVGLDGIEYLVTEGQSFGTTSYLSTTVKVVLTDGNTVEGYYNAINYEVVYYRDFEMAVTKKGGDNAYQIGKNTTGTTIDSFDGAVTGQMDVTFNIGWMSSINFFTIGCNAESDTPIVFTGYSDGASGVSIYAFLEDVLHNKPFVDYGPVYVHIRSVFRGIYD